MNDMPEWVKDFFINVISRCNNILAAWIDVNVMGNDPIMDKYHRELNKLRKAVQTGRVDISEYNQKLDYLKSRYKKNYPEWWQEFRDLLGDN